MKTQIFSPDRYIHPFQQEVLLCREQEETLLTQLIERESRARDHLLQVYTPLIVSLATEYSEGCAYALDDLVQEGICVLLEALAAGSFPRQGVTFRPWIIRHIKAVFEQITRVPEEQISLDRAVHDDACFDLEEPGEPFSSRVATPETVEEIVLAREQRVILLAALSTLTAAERIVLTKRYGLDGHTRHTYRELADGLGVSAERIRQIEEQGVQHLRAAHAPPLPAIQALHALVECERSAAA